MAALHLKVGVTRTPSSCVTTESNAISKLSVGPVSSTGAGRLSLSTSFLSHNKIASVTEIRGKEKLFRLKVHAAKVSIPNHGYDYYELLGVEPGASTIQIKQSYRWLQKRCHPDVAGGVGHDMSILLNEAYSTLTDLNARIMYDQLRVTWLEDDAFSGKPVWSTWLGSPEEDQAIFVDESQCVGCLKCAMIADNTFAIESTHGRARAIWQWGDDVATLEDAISACPVDCIKWVERSKLGALEHIMSQMPRMNVGLANHSAEGKRKQEDVFTATERFLHKRSLREAAQQSTQASPGERESAVSAAEAIRARSGRWWRPSNRNPQSTSASWQAAQQLQGALIPLAWMNTPEEVEAARSRRSAVGIPEELRTLHEAAQRRSSGANTNGKAPGGRSVRAADAAEEYWTPMEPISCPVSFPSPTQPLSNRPRPNRAHDSSPDKDVNVVVPAGSEGLGEGRRGGGVDGFWEKVIGGIPVVAATGAALVVGLTSGDTTAQSVADVNTFLPTEFVNGIGFQLVCAAVVWYLLGSICSGSLFLLLQAIVGGGGRGRDGVEEDGGDS